MVLTFPSWHVIGMGVSYNISSWKWGRPMVRLLFSWWLEDHHCGRLFWLATYGSMKRHMEPPPPPKPENSWHKEIHIFYARYSALTHPAGRRQSITHPRALLVPLHVSFICFLPPARDRQGTSEQHRQQHTEHSVWGLTLYQLKTGLYHYMAQSRQYQ
jgi:hypothetical protein